MFIPACEIESRFRANDAVGAVYHGRRAFVLFRHECCTKVDGDDTMLTVASVGPGDEFLSISQSRGDVWLVSKHGGITVVGGESSEILISEQTHLEICHVFPYSCGVGVVFAGRSTELAVIEGTPEATLSVTHSLSLAQQIVSASIGTGFSVLCSVSEALCSWEGCERRVSVPEICSSYCDETEAWIGSKDGSLTVVLQSSVLSLEHVHRAPIVALMAPSSGVVWSFDASGLAVAWCRSEYIPRGSLPLSAHLSMLSVGPTQFVTHLCGVSNGEVLKWGLAFESPAARDRDFLEYLCNLLSESSRAETTRPARFSSFSPLSSTHDSLPYLPEALITLSDTRLLLGGAFDKLGWESRGLYEDVQRLIRKVNERQVESSRLEGAYTRMCESAGIDIGEFQPQQGTEFLLAVGERLVELNAQLTEAAFISEKRIRELNVDVESHQRIIDNLEGRVSSLQNETSRFDEFRDACDRMAAQYRLSIEELEMQIADRECDLETMRSSKGESLTEGLHLAQVQLERELDDLTQNEVRLMSRVRGYQSQVVSLRRAVKKCIRTLAPESSFSELTYSLRSVLAGDETKSSYYDSGSPENKPSR